MIYKDFDDWFRWNCRGCRNFFDCKKILIVDRTTIPEKCEERAPEW